MSEAMPRVGLDIGWTGKRKYSFNNYDGDLGFPSSPSRYAHLPGFLTPYYSRFSGDPVLRLHPAPNCFNLLFDYFCIHQSNARKEAGADKKEGLNSHSATAFT
jgi:hypothetical protein